MKITSWRIIKTKRAKDTTNVNGLDVPSAFDGMGASLYPGRWNTKNTPMVYTASSQALAALEMLVHIDESGLLLKYSIFPVEFEKKHATILEKWKGDLHPDWNMNPSGRLTRMIGSDWAKSNHSLILAVPSAIVPNEYNYLINPYHPDLGKLTIGRATPFPFDKRLKQKNC